MNLTPLFTGLARGIPQYRAGQMQREEIDKDDRDRELRNMLAIYGEQRAREGMQGQQEDRRLFREQQQREQEAQDSYRTEQLGIARQRLEDERAQRMRDAGVIPIAGKGFAIGQSKADRELAADIKREEAMARIRAQFTPSPAPQIIQTADGIFTLGRNGQLTPLQNQQGGALRPPPPAATARASIPTGEERKGAALLAQAEEAYGALQQYQPSLKAQQASRVPIFGNTLAGRLDPEAQAAQQAGFQFADAYLRFVSGAAVPETEVRRYTMTFLPQPGDSPETVERKKSAQLTILKSLRIGAGRALQQPSARTGGPGPASGGPPPGPSEDPDEAWAADYLRRKRGGGG